MSGGFVSGIKFTNETEYNYACEDAKLVDKLKNSTDMSDPDSVAKLYSLLQSGEIKFKTAVGRNFDDQIYELMQDFKRRSSKEEKTSNNSNIKARKKSTRIHKNDSKTSLTKNTTTSYVDLDIAAEEILRKANKRRNIIIILASVIASFSLIYFMIYSKSAYASQKAYDELAALKGTTPVVDEVEQKPLFTLAEADVIPDILDEYKNIYIKNKSIVGWLTIDDTNIDYPVMQTVNNEYYLKHDLEGKEDNNGALFMDCNCNPMFRSTNLIIYGHHMKSGKMFGNLKKYESEEYCKSHNIIKFDTIYEKGTYEVMYVFHDNIKDAEDVSFKYYQFIDAFSKEEFDSNMATMSEMSMYDTGVTAEYGDELLTLSTCNGSTSTARFVVVAKRISNPIS